MFSRLHQDRRGVSVVEFALIFPLLAVLLVGMMAYGQYFLLAHTVQQLANDAARATVAGLSGPERTTLAGRSVTRGLTAFPAIDRRTVTWQVDPTADLVTVQVRLDATGTPLFATTLVPLPSPVIERSAVVRPGGTL